MNLAQPLARKYLEDLEALADEIEAGMDAVGAHDLPLLERSVSKQQELCTTLCRLSGQMKIEQPLTNQDASPGEPLYGVDRALAVQIKATAESLQALNQRYAALLKHSGESVRLFAGLCRSYTEHFERLPLTGASRPGWSCKS